MKKSNLVLAIFIITAFFLSGCASYKPNTFDEQTKRYNDYKNNYSIEILNGYSLLSSEAKENFPKIFLDNIPDDSAVFFNKKNESLIAMWVLKGLSVKNKEEKEIILSKLSDKFKELYKGNTQYLDTKVVTAGNTVITEFTMNSELGEGKCIATAFLFPLSANTTDYGICMLTGGSKPKYFDETKEDYLKMSKSLLLTAFSEMERKPNSPKSPEQPKDIVRTTSNPVQELPDNIKKEIKQKCTSDFPADYVKQAECLRKQEEAWMGLNR